MIRRIRRFLMRSDDSGVTLIELAMVSAIFMLVLGSVTAVFESATRVGAGAEARSQKLDELRGALDRVSKDVRQALSVSSASTSSRLTMASLVAGTESDVEYQVVNGELSRRVGSGALRPVADGLTMSAIFCYEPPACTLPSSGPLTLVELTLIGRPATPNAGPVTLRTQIQLRNARTR